MISASNAEEDKNFKDERDFLESSIARLKEKRSQIDLKIAARRKNQAFLSELRTKLLHKELVESNSDIMNEIFREIVHKAQFHNIIHQNETSLLASVNEVQNFLTIFTKSDLGTLSLFSFIFSKKF